MAGEHGLGGASTAWRDLDALNRHASPSFFLTDCVPL